MSREHPDFLTKRYREGMIRSVPDSQFYHTAAPSRSDDMLDMWKHVWMAPPFPDFQRYLNTNKRNEPMSRVTIFSTTPPPAPEQELCLRLIKAPYGNNIQMIAVNPATGRKVDSGVILEVTSNGVVRTAPGCQAPVLKTNGRGYVQINEG